MSALGLVHISVVDFGLEIGHLGLQKHPELTAILAKGLQIEEGRTPS